MAGRIVSWIVIAAIFVLFFYSLRSDVPVWIFILVGAVILLNIFTSFRRGRRRARSHRGSYNAASGDYGDHDDRGQDGGWFDGWSGDGGGSSNGGGGDGGGGGGNGGGGGS